MILVGMKDGDKLYCAEDVYELNKDFTKKNGAAFNEKYLLFKKGSIYNSHYDVMSKSTFVTCELEGYFSNLKRGKDKLISLSEFRERRLKKLCLK